MIWSRTQVIILEPDPMSSYRIDWNDPKPLIGQTQLIAWVELIFWTDFVDNKQVPCYLILLFSFNTTIQQNGRKNFGLWLIDW